MAGAYCRYCGHRCFVLRTVPDGPHAGWSGHMATCVDGAAHDRRELGGYDHTTAINPCADVSGAVIDLVVDAMRGAR